MNTICQRLPTTLNIGLTTQKSLNCFLNARAIMIKQGMLQNYNQIITTSQIIIIHVFFFSFS